MKFDRVKILCSILFLTACIVVSPYITVVGSATQGTAVLIGPVANGEILATPFSNLSTAIHASVMAGHTLLIVSPMTCNTLTTPGNIGIHITFAGQINVNSSGTLTIGCNHFEAGNYQVFYGSGNVIGLHKVTPVWFGAKTDDVTDDLASWQKANVSLNNGGKFVVPWGKTALSSGISVVQSIVFTCDEGGASSCIIDTGGSFDVITFNGTTGAGRFQGGGVRDITFTTSAGRTGGNYIAINAADRTTIENVIMTSGWNGIYVQDQNVATITNTWIAGMHGSYGIKIYGSSLGSSNVTDINNVEIGFVDNTATSPIGVIVDSCVSTVDIRHVAVVVGRSGLSITNTLNSGGGPMFVTAYDFQSDYPYDACINIDGGTGSTRSHQFTDFYCHGSLSANGIYVSKTAQHVSFKSGKVDSNYQRGMYLDGRYITVTDVQTSNNNYTPNVGATATFPGIEIGADSIGVQITGGLSGLWLGYATNYQTYGVVVDAGATSYAVNHVNLLGNTSLPFLDNANDSNADVGDNIGYMKSQRGTLTVLNGNSTGVFSHNLGTTPSNVQVTPTSNPGALLWWVTTNSTQVIVNMSSPASSGNITFNVEAFR